jgi:hypothetical protein
MKKKVSKMQPLKSQTNKREVLLRSSSSLDSEAKMTAHISDGNEEANCLYCCSLFSEDPEGEEWVPCSVCLMWAHTHCADEEEGTFVCEHFYSE